MLGARDVEGKKHGDALAGDARGLRRGWDTHPTFTPSCFWYAFSFCSAAMLPEFVERAGARVVKGWAARAEDGFRVCFVFGWNGRTIWSVDRCSLTGRNRPRNDESRGNARIREMDGRKHPAPRKSGLKRRRLTAPPPQLETTVDTNNTDKDVRPDRPFLLRRRQGPSRAPPGEIQNARRTPRLDPKRLPLHPRTRFHVFPR